MRDFLREWEPACNFMIFLSVKLCGLANCFRSSIHSDLSLPMTKAFPDRLQRTNQMASPRGSMSSSWIGVISHSSNEDRGLLILMRQSTEIEVTSRASRTQGYINTFSKPPDRLEKKSVLQVPAWKYLVSWGPSATITYRHGHKRHTQDTVKCMGISL